MNTYKRHRFPPDIISYAVWLYYRFNMSHRDIEDLLAERGIIVTRESIRLWCIKFGALYARRLKRKHRGYGDTFYIDEVFVKINGKQQSIGEIKRLLAENRLTPSRFHTRSVIDYLEITFVSLPSQIYSVRSRTGACRNPCQAVFQ
jgi:hypothetical protein